METVAHLFRTVSTDEGVINDVLSLSGTNQNCYARPRGVNQPLYLTKEK